MEIGASSRETSLSLCGGNRLEQLGLPAIAAGVTQHTRALHACRAVLGTHWFSGEPLGGLRTIGCDATRRRAPLIPRFAIARHRDGSANWLSTTNWCPRDAPGSRARENQLVVEGSGEPIGSRGIPGFAATRGFGAAPIGCREPIGAAGVTNWCNGRAVNGLDLLTRQAENTRHPLNAAVLPCSARTQGSRESERPCLVATAVTRRLAALWHCLCPHCWR